MVFRINGGRHLLEVIVVVVFYIVDQAQSNLGKVMSSYISFQARSNLGKVLSVSSNSFFSILHFPSLPYSFYFLNIDGNFVLILL